ncbi:NifU family protein [Rhodococcus sp. NPDC059234]|uniref:NifU family protein n=1 Tax=Rhodococcus sp. NPDC059234 TaxID=3346781 RepID=UPI0036701180
MDGPDEGTATGTDAPDGWRGAGERIDALLDASAAGGAVGRERAEQLVREVVDLYGDGLQRILLLLRRRDDTLIDVLARDELVSSLLLVHGLHPHDVTTRVRRALDSVRPYLGSHGGDVELLGVDDGVVRLQLTGSCRGCPSSAVTLELAVEEAVRAAAPETTSIVVAGAEPASASTAGLISAESLLARVRADAGTGSWVPAAELAGLGSGEVGGFSVAGLPLLACRLGDDLYAYRDRCPACTNSLAGAILGRRVGGSTADAVLTCPTCREHYDVRRAGAAIGGSGGHLSPLPVLVRDGVLSVAVPAAEVAG